LGAGGELTCRSRAEPSPAGRAYPSASAGDARRVRTLFLALVDLPTALYVVTRTYAGVPDRRTQGDAKAAARAGHLREGIRGDWRTSVVQAGDGPGEADALVEPADGEQPASGGELAR
jgi:hypothetical protein